MSIHTFTRKLHIGVVKDNKKDGIKGSLNLCFLGTAKNSSDSNKIQNLNP